MPGFSPSEACATSLVKGDRRCWRRCGEPALDEVFVTETDVTVDVSRHSGVLRSFDFEREGAELVAHGAVSEDAAWRFRRWRFNRA